MSTEKLRVARGVKVLDAKVPGWRNQIIPQSLDVNDPNNCILAQIFGSYTEGKEALGFAGRIGPAGHHGFAGGGSVTDAWLDELYGVRA